MHVNSQLILSEVSAQAMLGRLVLARLVDEDYEWGPDTFGELQDAAEALDLLEGARMDAMLREAGDL